MSIRIEPFGTAQSGRAASLITMTNASGASVSLTDFGASIVSVMVADAAGKLADVCLGFGDLSGYEAPQNSYLGATIGRYANRIGRAAFTLDGKEYALFANNGAHSLHGGREGFDKKIWAFQPRQGLGCDEVIFSYTAADGEEGYPGDLRVQVQICFDDAHCLTIRYQAQGDQNTVINLTNHAYFNLAGKGDVLGHFLRVDAASVVEVAPDLIPTGHLMPVDGTPYDLRTYQNIGGIIARKTENAMMQQAGGFDIGYALNGGGLRACAWLRDPSSGREMTVSTDQPGIQVYSGQGLKLAGKGGAAYGAFAGIALETQHHPDSVHHANFPSTVLKAGEIYQTTTAYCFGTYL